jgi:SAM-dependent methyltransferase
VDEYSCVRSTARRIRRRLEDAFDEIFYERRFGVETRGVLILSEHDDERRPYEGVRWRVMPRILRALDLSPADVFLDAGCGKGRAVFQAARLYPFARVIGFDFSADLVSVAQRNIERNAGRLKCTDVELVVADANVWPVPDDLTVILANNPFQGELFARFLGHVLDSFDRRPRPLRLVYVHPFDVPTIEQTGRFRLIWSWEASARGPGVRMYEAQPAPPT